MTRANQAEGMLKGTSSAAFNVSFLRTHPAIGGPFWGISDPREFRRRIALAQLADSLLIKDKLLLKSPTVGLAQIFHGFGPTMAIEVLRLGRVFGLAAPQRGTSPLDDLCWGSMEEIPEVLGSLLTDINFIEKRSKTECDAFVQEALDSLLIISADEHERIKQIAAAVASSWTQRGAIYWALRRTAYVYSRITDEGRGRPPTLKEEEELMAEGAYLIAYALAQAWYSGVPHSLFHFEEQNFLEAFSRQMGKTSNEDADKSSQGLYDVLHYANLPSPGLLVMLGEWGPRQVFECITSPEAQRLRGWLQAVRGGDFLKEYVGSDGKLPSRKTWVKWVRFAAVSAISAGFTFALTTNPVLATALGIGVGGLDTAYGEKLGEAVLPSWHPRIWIEQHARDVRMTTEPG